MDQGRETGSRRLHNRARGIVLRVVDVLVLLFGAFFAFKFLPGEAAALVVYTDFPAEYIWTGYLFAAVSYLPFLAGGVLAWRIFTDIGRDVPFTPQNARRLNLVCLAAVVEALVIACAIAYLQVVAHAMTPTLVLLVLVCIVFAILANALSHLTLHAAEIKDENDLTV